MSCTVLIFLALPSVTSTTFSIFNCTEVFNDGDKYLISDLNIKCWEGEHNSFGYTFGIPSALIWMTGVPLVMFIILYKKRI